VANNVALSKPFEIAAKTESVKLPCLLNISMDVTKHFSITLTNDSGEELIVGYDKLNNQYFIDRSKSGNTGFHKEFAAKHLAPRFTTAAKMDVSLLIDVSSVELFGDNGLTVMTAIFFPTKPYTKILARSSEGAVIKRIEYIGMKSIWK